MLNILRPVFNLAFLKFYLDDLFGGSGEDAAFGASAAEIAAQDRAIAEIRRQFDITQGNVDPFIQAGQSQLPGLQQGATVGGLDEVLGQIFGSGNFQNLVGERTRSVEGQLSSGGFTRSGTALQEIANVPTDLGFAIEQLLTGRQQSLAGQGQSGAINLGQFGAGASGSIAQLLAQQGVSEGAGILGAQQASAKGSENLLRTAATALAFSDPGLKENIEEIGQINDLKLYQWDWKERTKGTMIENYGTIGFMADEVKEIYPHHVYDCCGLMVVDYNPLLNELEAA